MKLEKDTIISHYKILSEIGKGGMGEVYRDMDQLNRFVWEAKAASAYYVRVFAFWEIER